MDRTSIIAVGICSILLLAWYIVYLPQMSARQEQARRETAAEQRDDRPAQEKFSPSEPSPSPAPEVPEDSSVDEANPAPPPATADSPPATSPGQLTPMPQQAETLRVLGSPEPLQLRADERMVVYLDPARAGIARIQLLKYQNMTDQGKVELATGSIPYLSLVYGDQMGLGETVRVVESSNSHAVFERQYAEPAVTLTETWRLVPERPYLIEYSVELENTGDTEVNLQQFRVSCGTMVSEETPGVGKAGTAGLVELAVAVKPPEERRPKSYPPKKISKLSPEQRGELAVSPLSWVALHNKYFVLHCEPLEGTFRGSQPGLMRTPTAPGEADFPVFALAALPRKTLPPGTSHSLAVRGYGGPKKLNLLKDMDNGLKQLMRLDLFLFFHPRWMEYLTNGILWALIELNDFFNSKWGYGYAIIVITFVIKMILWPLTHASTVSMHRMQAIQPHIKELKEQYKDQPQKLQKKTMELYREHKVNPLGGCLPILFQIPVFFALFNTFRSAIELRQASFLWVQDLSLPDTLPFTPFGFPLRPLAIFMGVTMLLQQMTTPTTGDPQQKKMMMLMPVFFMFIFYTMPAGLTLYWSANQVLTIIQNIISRRLHTGSQAKLAAPA